MTPRSLALAALLCGVALPAAAQVGHDPAHSPFRDVGGGATLVPYAGRVGGDGGPVHVGPQDGTTYGLRLDVRGNKFLGLALGVHRGTLQRRLINPFVQLANRDQGLVDQTVTFAEAGLQFNLTGGKHWHRLAPFVAGNVGAAFARKGPPADTSGYKFGTRIYVAPTAGLRLFITSRIHLRAEARALVWKVPYPASFLAEPPLEPGTPDKPNAVITDGRTGNWVTSRWLLLGLGIGI